MNESVGGNSTALMGLLSRVLRRTGSAFKTGFAVIGFAATAAGYLEYKRLFPGEDKESTTYNSLTNVFAKGFAGNEDKESSDGDGGSSKSSTNRVLVLPFHRMKIVEQKESSLQSFFSRQDDGSQVTSYEVRELVDVLHCAAADHTISAVYGVFGHGGTGMDETGWAQLDEVRNALQVVKESHRQHLEPNVTHQNPSEIAMTRTPSKPLYAYSDGFASFASPSNKDYYLASIFTHILLQEKGELNLFGMMYQQSFIRGFLEKYGVQLHVFKHGPYKNAPNMFTHQTFDKFHLESVTNLLTSINNDVCEDITRSRFKALSSASWLMEYKKGKTVNKKEQKKNSDNSYETAVSSLWKRIHDSGTFTGDDACKAGLVDILSSRDLLADLVERNVAKGHSETDDEVAKTRSATHQKIIEGFPSEHSVTLEEYVKQIATKKKSSQRRQQWINYANRILSSCTLKPAALAEKSKEKIALLHVNGAIGDAMSSKLVDSIRKIRRQSDTKCVVVRVSSPGGSIQACENIQQELKALNLPIIVSFGDVSASGGYYISAAADRIFAGKKTITGSIGVFGIRMDLTGLASRYGINVDQVTTGEYSGTYAPFHPMSAKMKANMSGQIDRYYSQFKQIVAGGRNISLENVETVAQGRIWTGNQAKSNGLIDELGGLHRALAYARRTYTSNPDTGDWSDVVVWPKKKSILEKLIEAKNLGDGTRVMVFLLEWAIGMDLRDNACSAGGQYPPVNNVTIRGMTDWLTGSASALPPTLTGILMTADENTAIRCLLDESRAKEIPEFLSFWK